MDDAAPKPLIPQVGEGKRGENGYLGYLLRQAAGAYRHRVERALADLRVTPPQFSVLTMLAAYPGISNADLARLALLTPQTVSTIVANLERAGAIVRQPHHYHGRIQRIDLSETGKSLLAACRERMQGIERHLADGLSREQESALRKWLVRVATSAPR
ncbi:MarR family transcriptional regulator [Acidithiobacillus sp. 'AMD consortium']|jgi:DNA-binding MarR family transcriptional regulator|uniref:MarR family transcriptional regulator n=2 Tax=Acidithiobacillus ferridurans TaxID=1232575 RepID=A0A8X8KB89_ACIFI|nr:MULTISPECIES: MarR family transcriptional regulator [Acidithiobacillus]MBU2714560.1 MarR family transcriptional regulator [Acidithiobacillus ferridurans]MBU2723592.1 MarR family transcriptional regulator [Acidithiobacillus ferridurans]MBU2725828.1 MarR family transcriptional regulator [Acidithiobacillus ferridurans]QFG78688.1 MarR family transcriptional regulator [Acidithiobacillus sp. 'AMD consortium']BBF66781.1 putative HTH-type transcriptional regulator [Acidithiobacillus ferridurans]